MSKSILFFWFRTLLARKHEATRCGHYTRRRGVISFEGESATMTLPVNPTGSVDYCLDCIGKMTIRCAWCGKPIFIGEPVTLYTPTNHDFKIPEHAVVHKEKPLKLVGCLRWDCADTGCDIAGYWVPGHDGKGCVHPMKNVFEVMLGAEEGSVTTLRRLSPEEIEHS